MVRENLPSAPPVKERLHRLCDILYNLHWRFHLLESDFLNQVSRTANATITSFNPEPKGDGRGEFSHPQQPSPIGSGLN